MKRTQRLFGVLVVLVMLFASIGNAAMAQDQGNQSGTSTQSGGGNAPPPMNNPEPEPEPEPDPEYVEPEPEPEYVEPEPEPEYTEPEAESEYVEPASDQQVQQAAPARATQSGSQSGASSSRGARAPNRPAPPPAPTPTPRPQNPPPSTGGGSGGGEFWILVDKSDHMLYAFRGNTQVFRAVNNLGAPGYDTPTGTFRINSKHRYEDMNTYGYLADVPYTMYFTNRGHAIHGTYWTAVNGRNVSHGCVNLSVGNAATLYGMTPIGTRVVIRW